MKVKKNKAWCWRRIDWPKYGYMAMVPIWQGEQAKLYIALNSLYLTLDQVYEAMASLEEELEEIYGGEVGCDDTITLAQLSLKRKLKNRAEFWGGPSVNYSPSSRLQSLLEAATKPRFFEILVTASDRDWPYMVATSISKGSPENLELFMMMTDWTVDETAATSAIYDINEVFTVEWKKKLRIQGEDLKDGLRAEN